MEISEKIHFNSEILTSEQSERHRNNLRIVNLNIDDINKRYDVDAEILYLEQEFKFRPYYKYDNKSWDVCYLLNHIVDWSTGDRSADVKMIERYIQNLKNDVDQSISQYYLDGNKSYLESNRLAFSKKFVNYYPVGFLSSTNESLIIKEVNKLHERFITKQ